MKWSVQLSFHSVDSDRDLPHYHNKFEEMDMKKVKRRILIYIKTKVTKLGRIRGQWFFMLHAMPYMPSGKCLDGEQMIRVRDKFSDRRILRVTDPDAAFVVGYGEGQPEELRR